MKDLKVIFMGTPDFSVPILKYLINNTDVILVVTQPDKIVGKKRKLEFSPIKKIAMENNISVFQPEKIKKDFEIIRECNPDIIITCAYGQIISKEILDIPRLGCINVHASLLPKYRGAAPIQWALLEGEKETGVTLMYMDEGMDTGDIIAKEKCLIDDKDDIQTLHDKLSSIGVDLLSKELPKICSCINNREKQNDALATYTKMIKREDELIDFNLDGNTIINKIRAFSPWPLTYILLKNQEVKVVKAEFEKKEIKEIGKITYSKKDININCKDGIIKLLIIKPFGKKEMNVSSFINGIRKEDNEYANR